MMVRCKTLLVGLGMAIGFVPATQAFSLLGPAKAWQVFEIGYDTAGSDIGGPMDPTEAYRWNIPTVVYAVDQSFSAYFGPQGVAAIDEAFQILNDIPPVSQITNDNASLYINGERVPFDTKRVNYRAQELGILDLKSTALSAVLEQLGLAEAERWVFGLRARDVTANGTVTNYTVIPLNFDPITFSPSKYVNNVLYTYQIFDISTPQFADAVEFPVDPLAFSFSSVSLRASVPGQYFTGLTHDDVGGLRFLLNPNHFVNDTLFTNNISLGTGRRGGSPWSPVIVNTNLPGVTNVTGGTNINYVAQATRPGIDKLNFIRGNYDSLLGQLFVPMTNVWNDRFISNGIPVTQNLQRAILAPDIVFSSEDLGLAADNVTPIFLRRTDTSNWINNEAINGGGGANPRGGPGNIQPPVNISFSNRLPFYSNQNPGFLDENNLFGSVVWGSFDGTTNEPVIYPKFLGWTLDDLVSFRRAGGN